MNKKLFNELLNNEKSFSLLILPLLSSASVLRKYETLKYLLDLAKQRKINTAEVYETLLQTYLFAGFPSALISLQIASQYFNFGKIRSEKIREVKKSGRKSCKKIYGNKFDKLIQNVGSFSPELSEWLITEGYGKVLSRKKLTLKKRELCIASILASLKFENQLYSHIKGAIRLGNSPADIKRIFVCLGTIGGKSITNFGNSVLKSVLKQKGKNSVSRVIT